jgi:mRNA interferase RelE/StbE
MATQRTVNKKLNSEVRALVTQILYEILNDPDFGYDLTAAAKRRLSKASTSKSALVSLVEIQKRYG